MNSKQRRKCRNSEYREVIAQRNHLVPRAEIVKLYSDDGKSWRNVCETCFDVVMEGRAKARANAHR